MTKNNNQRSKLPVPSKEKDLETKSQSSSILDTISNDAFNIVSSISNSECHLGSWVIDKGSYTNLMSLFDEWAYIADFEEYKDYDYLAYRHLMLGHLKNATNVEVLFVNPIQFVNSRRMLAPSRAGRWQRIGKDKDQFLQKLSDFRIEVRRHLSLSEIDLETRYLNCSYIPRQAHWDLSGFIKLEGLKCHDCEIMELILPNCNKLEDLDCSGNWLTSLKVGNKKSFKTLNCSDNEIIELNFDENRRLFHIDARNNDLVRISLSKEEFQIYDDEEIGIDSLDLHIEGNSSLKEIDTTGYDRCNISCDETLKIKCNFLKYDEQGDEVINRSELMFDKEEYEEAGGNGVLDNIEIEYITTPQDN